MFGAESQRGIAQFHDIYLYENCILRPNMQITLFRKYYIGKEMPSDTMGSMPFANFYEVNVDRSYVTVSISPLAKTATGFGNFSQMKNVTEPMTETMHKEIERAERRRKEREEERRFKLEEKMARKARTNVTRRTSHI